MWHCLPSDILKVNNWQAAFSIDQTVWSYGSALSAALQEVEDGRGSKASKKNKKDRVLAKWLPGGKADTSRHRDPAKESPDVRAKRA